MFLFRLFVVVVAVELRIKNIWILRAKIIIKSFIKLSWVKETLLVLHFGFEIVFQHKKNQLSA